MSQEFVCVVQKVSTSADGMKRGYKAEYLMLKGGKLAEIKNRQLSGACNNNAPRSKPLGIAPIAFLRVSWV